MLFCFQKLSPPVLWNRRWGWFELYHGPSKGCGGSNDCKTSHCGWQSLQHTSALVFCWTKKSDESFSYLGGHRLSVSLSFVVHDTTFQICIRGTSKDNDGVDLCTVVFLEFAQFHLGESNAFYIFLQESKISKFFRISWCPTFLSKTCFPPWSRAGQLARSHFRPIPRCGHQARPCWVWARAEGGNGFDTCQVAKFTLVSWKTKEKLWRPGDFFNSLMS